MNSPRLNRLRRFALLAAVVFGCDIAIAAPSAPDDLRLQTSEANGRPGDPGEPLASRVWTRVAAAPSSAAALGGAIGGLAGGAFVFLTLRQRLRKLRNALRSRDQRFQMLADQTSDVVLRLHGRDIGVTVDKVLGYGRDAPVGLSLDKLIHPADLAGVETALASLGEGAPNPKMTCRLRHRNGNTSWMESTFGRLVGSDHEPEIIATMRDLTHQRDESERLSRALDAARETQTAIDATSRAKGDFLASMSHEIRTPLNAILGFADLLLEDVALNASGRRSAERIKVGGDALMTILNDVLDYSQLGSGALRLNPRPFVLPLLVDECIALVERLAIAKNLTLGVDLVDRFPAGVMGDEARLRQILLNLVNNAIKFTHHGAVTVRIRYDRTLGPDRVVFEVSDTGIGIAPDDISNLFQPFRQVDNTVRRAYGGTGLGLAVSKMLVEMMSGEIGVTSVKGSGSTFWFALDLPAVPLVLKAERTPARPVAIRQLRILLVEDTPLNQELARAILEARGHQVDVVADGADAIMAVADRTYDLVLMDVQMPYVDGLTATQAIRILPGPGRFLPIVAMTANVMRAQVAAMREAGMDDVLGKPLSLGSLDALLERAGRNAVRAAPDPKALDETTLTKLAQAVGDARVEAMLAALATNLSRRFTLPLEPRTVPRLKAEAEASAAATAMLGFHRFSALCGRFVEADGGPADVHAALLRELSHVVALAGARHAPPRSPSRERSAA